MPGKRVGIWHIALVGLVAVYAPFLSVCGSGAAVGSDASGYLNSARMLAAGQLTTPLRRVPGVPVDSIADRNLMPLGFVLGRVPGTLIPKYPVGLPLHLVAASRVVGWGGGGPLVNTAAAVGALLLMFALGRRLGLPPAWAFASVVLFAVFPVTIRYYTRTMSDGLATTWCIAAIYCAFRAREGDSRWPLLAGVSVSVAVLVRPTNVLLIPAVAIALPHCARAFILLAGGGLPAAVFLGWYNHALFGKLLDTGYGEVSPLLRWSYLVPRIKHFGYWIARFMSPVALVAWMASAYRACRGDRRHLALLAWVCGVVGFYAFYYHSLETWWYLRFILPAIPALILGAALAALELSRKGTALWHSRPVRLLIHGGLVAVVVLAVVLSLAYTRTYRPWDARRSLAMNEQAVALTLERVGSNAVVVSREYSGALYFYSAVPVVRFDLISARSLQQLVENLQRQGQPLCALLWVREIEQFQKKAGTGWTEIGVIGNAHLLVPASARGTQ